MNEIVIAFKNDDNDFKEILLSNFKEEVQIFETDGFDGSAFIFVALIPIVGVTVELVDFFLTHLARSKDKHADSRVIMKSKGDYISMSGFNKDEVIEILNAIKDEKKE